MTQSLACQFIGSVMMESFSKDYLFFSALDVLDYELSNIFELCAPILTGLEADDQFLREEVLFTITEYLNEV